MQKTVEKYVQYFQTLAKPVTKKVPYINIIMIGETGAGKSSLLNTFATAIANSDRIKDTYRVSPNNGREESVTRKVRE